MSTLLDTGIALAMVFFLVSLLASALQESIAASLNSRGKLLERAIIQLLTGSFPQATGLKARVADSLRTIRMVDSPAALSADVLNHGLLDGLYRGDRLPSYIPAEKFADSLIDVLRRRTSESMPTVDGMLWAIRRNVSGKPREALETMLLAAGQDVVRFRTQVIDWFNATMDRASGWYTRTVRYRTFLLGLALAAALQIDAIRITTDVSHNAALRASLVTAAEAKVQEGANPTERASKVLEELNEFSLPIGWSWCDIKLERDECERILAKAGRPGEVMSASELLERERIQNSWHGWNLYRIFLMLTGWLITALAVSQGAPFWFALINQLVSIRGSGNKPKDNRKASMGSSAQSAGISPPWAPPVAVSPAVPDGMTADDVRNVQRKLGIPITGVVDAKTRDTIREFQVAHRVPTTGTLDLVTAREILSTT